MPKPVSKKQYRMMMAVLHGKGKGGAPARGAPPKSVAGKYAGKGSDKDLPEQSGRNEGGTWGEGHKAKDKERVDSKREKRKEDKKAKKAKGKERKAKLKKSLEEFIKSHGYKGTGCLVVNGDGQILLGRRTDNGLWSTPGGHVEEGEEFSTAAIRELKEETGLTGRRPREIHSGFYRGYDSKTFLVDSWKGRLKETSEMVDLKFMDICDVPWDMMADYARDAVSEYLKEKLSKSKDLKSMIAFEDLQKNIMRGGKEGVTYELTHGDALKLVGNGTFRMLREAVEDMGEEDFREVKVDNYTLHIRKHHNDVYSGRIEDGHKVVHQFTNKSLPSIAAELMSVFEWYLPEDEGELEIVDDGELDSDVIEGGLQNLIDKYKQHNIVNIYSEMENIREEIRHGNAVDLQQVESKIMTLFDKLEERLLDHADKHNSLAEDASKEIDVLEAKLLELQRKIEDMGDRPTTVRAVAVSPHDHSQVHSSGYPYLTKPTVEISPNGSIKITFGKDWAPMEQQDFLKDLKAKVIKHD